MKRLLIVPLLLSLSKERAFVTGCNLNTHTIFDLELQTDSYGYETSWELINVNTFQIVSAGLSLENNQQYNHTVCVDKSDCLEFTIRDSFGDGIFLDGYFNVYFGGLLVLSCSSLPTRAFSKESTLLGDSCSSLPTPSPNESPYLSSPAPTPSPNGTKSALASGITVILAFGILAIVFTGVLKIRAQQQQQQQQQTDTNAQPIMQQQQQIDTNAQPIMTDEERNHERRFRILTSIIHKVRLFFPNVYHPAHHIIIIPDSGLCIIFTCH